MNVRPLVRSIVAAAALSALGGCIAYPSLHGVPAEHGTELPEGLLGEWRHEQDEELLEVVVSGTFDDGYEAHVRFAEEDQVHQLRLAFEVVRVGDQTILDATLADETIEQLYSQYGAFVIPAHVFLRVTAEGHGAKLYWLDPDWMGRAGQLVVPRLRDAETLPLWTMGPELVLAVLGRAAGTEEAWAEISALTRAP